MTLYTRFSTDACIESEMQKFPFVFVLNTPIIFILRPTTLKSFNQKWLITKRALKMTIK